MKLASYAAEQDMATRWSCLSVYRWNPSNSNLKMPRKTSKLSGHSNYPNMCPHTIVYVKMFALSCRVALCTLDTGFADNESASTACSCTLNWPVQPAHVHRTDQYSLLMYTELASTACSCTLNWPVQPAHVH